METKMLPLGVEDFEEIRRQGFYYVDKTGLITDLLTNRGKVNLFTRPRRFGKSLNMSMLRSFFEIGADRTLFDGLAVSREKELCDRYLGKFPVINISFKAVEGTTFDAAYDMLCTLIQDEALRLQFLQDSESLSDEEKQQFKKLTSGDHAQVTMKNSLKTLSRLLEKHYGQKTIVLIDEYDVPLDKAYAQGYYDEMIDLIRAMFNAALKGNTSLFFAVLTGCLRISKESIFTGLNNPKVRSISDVKFDEYFGFTDEEVRKILADYKLEDHYEEMREWYDGYLFGEQNVYCPWDVINYCDDLGGDPKAEPQDYWANTSGNDMVRKLIEKSGDATLQMDIEQLIEGKTITKALNERLTHNEIEKDATNIWSILYMTGYLTIVRRPSGGVYCLRIPNREIRKIFVDHVLDWLGDEAVRKKDELPNLYAAFETGDTQTIVEYLNEQLLETVSFYDAKESFYHGFLVALLSTCSGWDVSSNDETGRGRSDIAVQRKDRKIGFVVEVKNVKDESKLEAACANAMKQIEERNYTAGFRRFRVKEIWTYGIAFCDKECRVIAKKVTT